MFNRSKSNQKSSKRTGWNGRFGRFRDPVVEWIPCLCGKEKEERSWKIAPNSFLVNHFTESLWNNILSHCCGVFK